MVRLVPQLDREYPILAEILEPSLNLALSDRDGVVSKVDIEDKARSIGEDEVGLEIGRSAWGWHQIFESRTVNRGLTMWFGISLETISRRSQ
jgi:hypothetical protein